MTTSTDPIVLHMQELVYQWQAQTDQRFIFLDCYQMMTANMLEAIQEGEFNDPAWVNHFLRRFAEYYFVALERFDDDPLSAPVVWQLAHNFGRDPEKMALQKLLLGVNAHINYDLVLTLVDILQPEWQHLSQAEREARYSDHCRVNTVIGRTIDAVQDQVLEPSMRGMELVDLFMGPLDEFIISRLITRWRDSVWDYAVRLLEACDEKEHSGCLLEMEAQATRRAEAIGSNRLVSLLDDLI